MSRSSLLSGAFFREAFNIIRLCLRACHHKIQKGSSRELFSMCTIKAFLVLLVGSSTALCVWDAQAGSVQRNWGTGIFRVTFGGVRTGAKQTGGRLRLKQMGN